MPLAFEIGFQGSDKVIVRGSGKMSQKKGFKAKKKPEENSAGEQFIKPLVYGNIVQQQRFRQVKILGKEYSQSKLLWKINRKATLGDYRYQGNRSSL